MKNSTLLTLTMIALAGFMAPTTARAQNPHFLRCGASGVNSDGSLNVSFTIAGLGSNQSIDITASAHADATYACRNRGNNCPNAANKVNVQTDVSATGTFTSGKNGSIRASLTVDPPDTTLTCPGGQKLVLVSVSYTGVAVSAQGAGACSTSPGTFAANFFPNCP
jgi:hypothetical protein